MIITWKGTVALALFYPVGASRGGHKSVAAGESCRLEQKTGIAGFKALEVDPVRTLSTALRVAAGAVFALTEPRLHR